MKKAHKHLSEVESFMRVKQMVEALLPDVPKEVIDKKMKEKYPVHLEKLKQKTKQP